ncbi:hypothetical protein LAYK6_12140 [Lactobacillus amylovorus subsp. amylovorus]|uniref:hypothetical protein n=1 Tax=Lactobacillus amylovorus TaxID=1604 RepID=UPI002844F320|nr:hypothetical protein LAYK6_12140 [Lactobacillus amylovorus]
MSSELDKRVEEFFRNYQDRGMKKWAGFYLSDQTAKINQEQRRRDTVYVKKKPMIQKDIRAMLMQSFGEHRKVSVQLKELSVDSDVKADIVGFVEGYQEDTANISRNLVLIEDINHIEFIE